MNENVVVVTVQSWMPNHFYVGIQMNSVEQNVLVVSSKQILVCVAMHVIQLLVKQSYAFTPNALKMSFVIFAHVVAKTVTCKHINYVNIVKKYWSNQAHAKRQQNVFVQLIVKRNIKKCTVSSEKELLNHALIVVHQNQFWLISITMVNCIHTVHIHVSSSWNSLVAFMLVSKQQNPYSFE